MIKKGISIGLILVMIAGLMTGCLTSGGSGSKKSKTDLTGMYVGTESDAVVKYYKGFVDSFNQDNEFGVTLDMQFYENEQYKTKLTTLMASNNVPDVFFTWELDYLKPFVEGGKVYDITDMLNQDTELKDSFQDGVIDPLTYDDKVYALPTQLCFTPMFYNKKIFAENGVSVPQTWEEFLAVCDTLKQNGVTPISIPAPDAWIPAQFVQQIVNGIGGIEVYEGLLDGSVKWNNDTHVKAGETVQGIVNKGYLQEGFLGMTSEEGKQIMKDGKTAMYFMGSWEISELIADNSSIKEDVGAFSLPAVDAKNNHILVGSVDSSMAISSQTKNPEACFGFIKHWVNEENQTTLLYDAGRIPATKIEIDESKIAPLMAECLEISNNTVGLTPWLDRAFGAGEGVEFNNTCQSIYGGESPKTCFDNLQTYVEDNADN